jgi:hypothetical protein
MINRKLEIRKVGKSKKRASYSSAGIPLQPAVLLAFMGARLCLLDDPEWELEVKDTFQTVASTSQTQDPAAMAEVFFTTYASKLQYRHKVSKMKSSLYSVRNPVFVLVDCFQNDRFAELTGAYMCAGALEVQAYIGYRQNIRAIEEMEVTL